MHRLVIDIGNSRSSAAVFNNNSILEFFAEATEVFPSPAFQHFLEKHTLSSALIASVHRAAGARAQKALEDKQLRVFVLTPDKSKVRLDVDEPQAVGADRIANFYGALHLYPSNDCVIIDIGTAITVDYVTADGKYLGGSIFPGFHACSKALSQTTDLLNEIEVVRPEEAIAKTTTTQIQSGIYYGILGAVERMAAECVHASPSPGSVKIIATGGYVDPQHPLNQDGIVSDIPDLVDHFEPQLTLIGLNEILKELIN